MDGSNGAEYEMQIKSHIICNLADTCFKGNETKELS
jgi:hypothetical protein